MKIYEIGVQDPSGYIGGELHLHKPTAEIYLKVTAEKRNEYMLDTTYGDAYEDEWIYKRHELNGEIWYENCADKIIIVEKNAI